MANPTPYPSLFSIPNTNIPPHVLFRPGQTPPLNHCWRCVPYATQANRPGRLISIIDPHAVLIYVGGGCLYDINDEARAGCAYLDGVDTQASTYSGDVFRLEDHGPTGQWHKPTNHRAQLRAIIAVLEAHNWEEENVRTLVFATNSDYVANGCTMFFDWAANRQNDVTAQLVDDQDMWEIIPSLMEHLWLCGVAVQFWLIPREWNVHVFKSARRAANYMSEPYYRGISYDIN